MIKRIISTMLAMLLFAGPVILSGSAVMADENTDPSEEDPIVEETSSSMADDPNSYTEQSETEETEEQITTESEDYVIETEEQISDENVQTEEDPSDQDEYIIEEELVSVEADADISAATIPVITGIWDPNGDAIDFAAEGASIGYTGNLTHPEIKKVRLIVNYPAGSTDQVLRVKLAEGIVWADNGATGTPSLVSVTGPVGNTKVGSTTIQDGEYTYSIQNGTTTFTLEFNVKYDNRMDMAKITDAITVNAECKKDGETLSAEELTLKNLDRAVYENGLASASHLTGNKPYSVKVGEVSNSNRNSINVVSYYSDGGVTLSRFITNVKITVVADSRLEYVGLGTNGGGIALQTTTAFDNNNQPTSVTDNGDGTTTYIFTKSVTWSGSCAGFKGNWKIPADAEIGEDFLVAVTGIEYSLYGNDTPYVYTPTAYYTYTAIDAVAVQDKITVGANGYTISSHPSVYEVNAIGYFCFSNDGVDPTTPKLITYNFPEGLHIIAIDIPSRTGNNSDVMKRVDYKLAGSDEWVTCETNIRLINESTKINMADLGIADTQRVSGLRLYYEFPNPNATGTAPYEVNYGTKVNHTDGGWGYRIYASRDDLSNDTFVTTVDFENLYASEGDTTFNVTNAASYIVPDADHTIVRRQLTTKYDENKIVNMVRVQSSGLTTAIAGSPLSLSFNLTTVGANQSDGGGLAATLYPKIYLRDETGSEISNVKLVNSDGVDIISEYGITCAFDHAEDNGTRVYVIDTSPLANRTDDGRLAAAVGYLWPDNTARTLKLTYDVNVRSDYNDNSQVHNLSDAVFIANGYGNFSITCSSSHATEADPYGVDGTVGKGGERIYQFISSGNGGTYKVISKDDISVSFMAKRADAEDYEIYNPDSPIQVVANADYNVKVTVANNSGVTTGSSEEQTSYIYIPIPKRGEDWGGMNLGQNASAESVDGFGFTMNLTSAITAPVVTDSSDTASFAIEYAKINTASAGFASMTDQEVGLYIRENVTSWGAYSSDANCIRIAAKGLKGETAYDFVMNITVDAGSESQEMNVYNAVFYENLTTQDLKVYSGIYSSDSVGFKVVWGNIGGRVYADNDNSGTYNAGDELLSGVSVRYVNTEDSSVKYNMTTAADGSYSGDHINPGTYSITLSGYDSDKYTLHENVPETVELPQVVDGHTVYEITQDIPLVPSYEVTYHFVANGEIPAGVTVPAAQADILAGSNASIASVTTVDHYTFEGWYKNESCTGTAVAPGSDVAMTGNLELYGKWTIDKHTVVFENEDGTELSSAEYAYGTAAADIAKPAAPSKAPTDQYTYTFAGWSPDVTDVTGDVTYTATYSETVNEYTVKFVDEDGRVLSNASYPYGTAVADIAKPADPTKAPTAQYTYTFSGWSPDVTDVTGDVTYTATYSETVNEYTVKFVDEDGTVLSSTQYDYGTAAADITKPADPTKAPTAQYTYTFSGWTPAIAEVTGDATYTATYSSTVNKYTVTFVDEDGTVLSSAEYAYGTAAANIAKPSDPTKAPTAQYTYTFVGWSPAVTNVTGDATYQAVYTDSVNSYNVTFVDDDGTVLLGATEYPYGTEVSEIIFPEEPTKEATVEYTYTFSGWTPEVSTVTGDVTYTATYSATINEYSVEFVDEDGTVILEATSYPYGTVAADIIMPDEPSKDPTAQYTYTFAGWSPDVTDVTGDVTYTASYTSTINQYTISYSFSDINEVVDAFLPDSATLDYGTEYTAEKVVDITGYSFDGWYTDAACSEDNRYVDGTVLTGDLTLYGKYISNAYAVTFDANGGDGEISDLSVRYDNEFALPAEGLSREGCELAGWSTTADSVLPQFLPGATVSNLAEAEGDVVALYAIWVRTDKPVAGEDYKISLNADTYTEGDVITLSAIGYWPSETPILGDVKIVPTDWHHDDPSGNWEGIDVSSAAYNATFTQPAGEYVIHVNFASYSYGADGWIKDEEPVELTATYKVVKSESEAENTDATEAEPVSEDETTETVTPVPTPAITDAPVPGTLVAAAAEAKPAATAEATPVATATPTSAVASTGEETSNNTVYALVLLAMAILIGAWSWFRRIKEEE